MTLHHEAPIRGGNNIALKVPTFCYEAALAFYRDVLQLPYAGEELGSPGFEFGDDTLWVDHRPAYPRSDVWLQIRTADVDGWATRLAAEGVPMREEVEPYEDVPGYWISDPSGVVIRLSPE
jgi:catechol 2,3-dioxygenase-like lactoylglutathione lyase family enzyme